jgi:hypothetical protein
VAYAGAPQQAFVLSGLIVFDDGDGKAWLREPSLTRNEVVLLRRGDTIGPWTLTRILPQRVELDGPGGKVIVPLAHAGAGGGDGLGAGAPGPAPSRPTVPSTVPLTARPQPVPTAPASDVAVTAPAPPMPVAPATAPRPPVEASPSATPGPSGPSPASRPRAVAAEGPSATPPATIHFGVGDPRRRDSILQLFGPR